MFSDKLDFEQEFIINENEARTRNKEIELVFK
jgi:hypothetical protein